MASLLIFPAPLRVDYEQVDLPDRPGKGQVLCSSIVSGISHGTEMVGYCGTSPFVHKKFADRVFLPLEKGDEPFYPYRWAGYDLVGRVEAVGEGVTGFAPGDRVWWGRPHQDRFVFSADDGEVVKLSDRVADEEAIFLNLTSIALVAVHDAAIKIGDTVAVFGAGLVGQLAAQLAVVAGAGRVIVVEPDAGRRAVVAAHAPVETIDPKSQDPALTIRQVNAGRWPDVVIECSGHIAGLQEAVRTIGVGGTVVAAGFYCGQGALNFSEEFLHNRVQMIASMGVWSCPSRYRLWDRRRVLSATAAVLASGKLNLADYITARVPFSEGQRAYELIRNDPGKHWKVAFVY